jgi:O-antigen ligase/polysaccharide polymerase Wzy-like membrane protein
VTITLEHALRRDTGPVPTLEPVGGDGPARGTVQRTAMIMLVAAIIFQPILHPAGPGNSSPVDLFTVASIVTGAIWITSSHHKARAPYLIPFLLMLGAGAASGLFGPLPGLALLTLLIDLLLFAWCTTVVNVLSAPRLMRCALVAWSWSGIFWAGVVIVAWLGHITALEGLQAAEGNRVLFTFGDPNYASTYWDATIFVVYACQTPSARWMRIVGYLMLGWALALTESNGGALALGISIFFLLLIRSHRKNGLIGAVATGLIVVLAIGGFFTAFPLNSIRSWALNSGQPLLVNSLGRSAQSSDERGELIVELTQLYEQTNGILGNGPASTKPLLTTDLYPYANEAHNDFLAELVERGPIGLLGLLLLIGTAIYWAMPIVRRRLSARYAAVVPLPAGLVAGLLALSVNSFYEEVLHFRFFWALLGIIAILGKDARR